MTSFCPNCSVYHPSLDADMDSCPECKSDLVWRHYDIEEYERDDYEPPRKVGNDGTEKRTSRNRDL